MDSALMGRHGVRMVAMASLAAAVAVGMLALLGPSPAAGRDPQDCEVSDLGTLGNAENSTLQAEGRWTTKDCDSRFRKGNDAHTYRFKVAESGRVRISLNSAKADSYLYLLDEDGQRITDDDDRGERLNARVESDLTTGYYMVEATTTSGRGRGSADFTLTVSRVKGCDTTHLGALSKPGEILTATGSWSLDTCGSRFVTAHPAHGYSFNLARSGRVRVDLISEDGDPVLSLISPSVGVIGANDDGGGRRNARINRYLHPGVYFIEATTYLERDYQPLQADFVLKVTLVDEQAQQNEFNLKIEQVHTPAQVVVGDPVDIHYRIGNAGGAGLPGRGNKVIVYVVGPGVFHRIDPTSTSLWRPGAVYHTGDETKHAKSITDDQLTPFEVVFKDHGPTWVFVAVLVRDANGDELGFHGLWHNLMVHSNPTFDAVGVQVGNTEYTVSAAADTDGLVDISVESTAAPEAEIDSAVRAKAVYTAGVRTQLLDGVFERSAVAALPDTADSVPVNVGTPSSSALLKVLGQNYFAAVSASGLPKALKNGEAVNPVVVEKLVLDSAETAAASYAPIAVSWRTLLERMEDDKAALTFDEAFKVHSQLVYVEDIISPAVAAGKIVSAAQAAKMGWEDTAVQAMLSDPENCKADTAALRRALKSADAKNISDLLVLNTEIRATRPVHGLAVDNSLCALADADKQNTQMLQRLSIAGDEELKEMLGLAKPATSAPRPAPHRLRIIARLADDGRVEHGVELVNGEQVLPPARFLPADAPVGKWRVSRDVEVDDSPIGRIRTRRRGKGRIEMGFISADGKKIVPDIAYLPAELPEGVWLRSSEISVPRAAVMDTAEDENQ